MGESASFVSNNRGVCGTVTTFGFDLVQLTGHDGPNMVFVHFHEPASRAAAVTAAPTALEGNEDGNPVHSLV